MGHDATAAPHRALDVGRRTRVVPRWNRTSSITGATVHCAVHLRRPHLVQYLAAKLLGFRRTGAAGPVGSSGGNPRAAVSARPGFHESGAEVSSRSAQASRDLQGRA